MVRIISRTLVTRDDQMEPLVGGPFHIITGKNLIKRKPPTLIERVRRRWRTILKK